MVDILEPVVVLAGEAGARKRTYIFLETAEVTSVIALF
jgi:hypothetical protein